MFVAAYLSRGFRALCYRAAGKSRGSTSLHSTLKRIQKELAQGQAGSGWQAPATTDSVNSAPAGEAESALAQQPPADAAAVDVDVMDSTNDTDVSASTGYGAILASKAACCILVCQCKLQCSRAAAITRMIVCCPVPN